jgi:polyhydroxyalkanoate synthesis regulator phasin
MLAEIAAGVIKGLYEVVRSFLKTGKSEKVQDHIAKNEYIQQKLEEMLDELGASRIYVIQFHNGGYFYSGTPMQKFSCTYEAVNGWVSPTMGELQNRLVSEYPLLHTTLINTGEFYIEDVSKFPDNATRQKFEKRGIRTFYAAGIWDLAGNKVGNISVNYVGSIHLMTDEEKNVVQDFARQIVGYIVPADVASESYIPKLIVGFLGLTCLSQLFYFLNNFFILMHQFGPMVLSVLKALTDFL